MKALQKTRQEALISALKSYKTAMVKTWTDITTLVAPLVATTTASTL